MSYDVYCIKNRAEKFVDFEHPTCKGKSKSQPFAHTFALTGRRRLCADTQGVALGYELATLSGRSFSRFVRLSCALCFATCYLAQNRAEFFQDFEHPTFQGRCRFFASLELSGF